MPEAPTVIRSLLIWIAVVVGGPLLLGRLEHAESLPFVAFLVVLAVVETVRSISRLRHAERDRVIAGAATLGASLAGLAVA